MAVKVDDMLLFLRICGFLSTHIEALLISRFSTIFCKIALCLTQCSRILKQIL